MSDNSTPKTLLMAAAAVTAIVVAIVVAINTFSEPSVTAVKPPTEPIRGSWVRKEGLDMPNPPQGVSSEHMIANDIVAFDVTNAASGTVALTTADGNLEGTVMNSQPGHLLLQVKTKSGKTAQLTIAQMGDGGPAVVTDGITTTQFERKP